MSLLNVARVSRAPVAALAAVGVFWGTFAAIVPALKQGIGASDGAFGMVLVMSAAGGLLANGVAPWVGRRIGRPILPLAGLLLALACLYPAWAGGVIGFGVAMFFVGVSVALLDISANVRISVLEERHGMHLMNFNHAMFSVAFALAAWSAGWARRQGFGPEAILPVAALVALGLAAVMWEGAGRYRAANDAPDPVPARMPWAAIIATGAILFAAFIGENATEAWSALHIERTLGGAPGEGGFGPAMLGLTMAIGRMAGQVVAAKLGEARLILVSACLGIVGALVIAVAPTQGVVLLGVAVLGMGMSVIVPSANSILGRVVRNDQRAFALSRAWMLGMIGFFAGPAMMGLVAELVGLRWSFAVVSLVVASIIPSMLVLRRRG